MNSRTEQLDFGFMPKWWLERSKAVLRLPAQYLNKQPAVGVPHESAISLDRWLQFFTPLSSGGAQ